MDPVSPQELVLLVAGLADLSCSFAAFLLRSAKKEAIITSPAPSVWFAAYRILHAGATIGLYFGVLLTGCLRVRPLQDVLVMFLIHSQSLASTETAARLTHRILSDNSWPLLSRCWALAALVAMVPATAVGFADPKNATPGFVTYIWTAINSALLIACHLDFHFRLKVKSPLVARYIYMICALNSVRVALTIWTISKGLAWGSHVIAVLFALEHCCICIFYMCRRSLEIRASDKDNGVEIGQTKHCQNNPPRESEDDDRWLGSFSRVR